MRMKIWQTPKTDVEGAFIASDWKRMVDYLKDQGMLKQDVPLDRVYTDKFIKDINDFDKAAIEKQAREYKI
jgi:NitT/TauT family transport system substrate-binding protein